MSDPQVTIKTLPLNPNSEGIPLEIVSVGPPLWRLQLVRVLQLIGVGLGVLGGADVLNLVSVLSPEASKWLTVSGPALFASAKPIIMLIGDYLDDGQKNYSFKIP